MSAEVVVPADPLIEFPCDNGCGHWSILHMDLDGKRICVHCWTRLGKPFPRYHETREEAALRMDAINRKALAYGGAAAHMVRSGKT